MAVTCPKCRRANPAEATYCYFDGSVLSNGHAASGPINPATAAFPMPFVFPSGHACHNFDQLALGCLNNWSTARDLVRQGMLKGFLGGLGRADLALAAEEAARYPDKDRGLAQLLSKLPTKSVAKPKLVVKPMQINLGVLRVGSDKPLELRLGNEGLGLVYGSVQSDDANPWLALLNVPVGSNGKLFQFVDETVISLLVRGQSLRAGNKPLEAKLTVESNAGTQTVVVTADVPVTPFPGGVLAGAVTPRKIAEKAKAAPKEAAVLFENGAVQQWYKDNGWQYPVQGPSASGLAAVQQFFEALGLTPPPKVQLSVSALALDCYAGGSLRSVVEVTTPEKRPIYAHAVSDQPWLKVERAQARGRTVTIPLSVPMVPHCPGETLHAKLTVTSNGNQRFEVPVSLAVGRSAAAVAAVPVLDMMEVVSAAGPTAARGAWHAADAVEVVEAAPLLATAAAPARGEDAFAFQRTPPRRTTTAAPPPPAAQPVAAPSGWLPWLPILFLLFGLCVTGSRDVCTFLYAWLHPPIVESSGGEDGPKIVDTVPRITLDFHDEEIPVTLGEGGVKPVGGGGGAVTAKAVWEPSMRFGLVSAGAGQKRLTYEPKGLTNNTVVKLDGQDTWFGERPFRRDDGVKTYSGQWLGDWRDRKKPLGKDDKGRERIGYESAWYYEAQRVVVTQTVEIVPGTQSNLLDTCLVHYRITNDDNHRHKVGLRFMLDTYIGANDGVPFLIPDQSDLCDTKKEFPTPDSVPDFIQACEFQDLVKPGTIARIGLKVPGLEAPAKVTLGAWPNPALVNLDPRCAQEKTKWDVPVLSMQSMTKLTPPGDADSCVVIYWSEEDLAAGKSRDVGFTYGLGAVSGGEGKGKLALTAGGAFVPGGSFTVTAYVSNPVPNQTVTLTLPDGFEFITGDAKQPVPPVPAGAASQNSPVTWKVRASQKAGEYVLKGQTSTGETQSLKVYIKVQKVQNIFGN